MTFAAIALEVLGVLKLVPDAADVAEAFLRRTPDATPETLRAHLQEYAAASAARRESVRKANEALADD